MNKNKTFYRRSIDRRLSVIGLLKALIREVIQETIHNHVSQVEQFYLEDINTKKKQNKI